MNIVPLEFSIVVVGEDCNPTILNPDFLECRGIVPKDWGWEPSNSLITSRALSIIPYDSGVMIKVELNRFQVTQIGSLEITDSKIVEIARRYIETLPHVRYRAVGINIRTFVPMEKPDEYLRNRFIQAGPWHDQDEPMGDVSLSFIYAHEDSRLTISLESKIQLLEQGEETHQIASIEIGGNYHRECKGYPTDAQVISHIEKAPADAAHFLASVSNRLLAEK